MSHKPEVATISFKGQDKPFLLAHDAITWFRQDYPGAMARINTRIEQIEGIPNNIVLAEIWIRSDDGKMELVSTARKMSDGAASLEKLETSAIRRALAFLGYGTVAAMADDANPDNTLDPHQRARVAVANQDKTVEERKEILTGGKNGPRKFESKPEPKAEAITFTTSDFDRAYFEGTIDDLFNGTKHRDNAIAKMFRDGDLTPDMDADDAIEAVMAKYKGRVEATGS